MTEKKNSASQKHTKRQCNDLLTDFIEYKWKVSEEEAQVVRAEIQRIHAMQQTKTYQQDQNSRVSKMVVEDNRMQVSFRSKYQRLEVCGRAVRY
jgi:hypothetical protein